MKLSKLAKTLITERWFHGTPDARDIQKIGGFTERTKEVDYIEDLKGYQDAIQQLRNAEDKTDLFKQVADYKKKYKYRTPLFLTDKFAVAKTYADPKRAFDYQNAQEKVYEVEVTCNKIVQIVATGDRFRFIPTDKVKSGFINAGVSREQIDKLISMFNYYIEDNKGIQTDVIAAIGNWLDFDCIDVIGVLDSYQGGKTKSTVRMVLDPTKVKIKK